MYVESDRDAHKRKLGEASQGHENAKRVLQLLRDSQDMAVEDIINHIKESATLEEAIDSISSATLLLPSPASGIGMSLPLCHETVRVGELSN